LNPCEKNLPANCVTAPTSSRKVSKPFLKLFNLMVGVGFVLTKGLKALFLNKCTYLLFF
jgi:hypothetical protein